MRLLKLTQINSISGHRIMKNLITREDEMLYMKRAFIRKRGEWERQTHKENRSRTGFLWRNLQRNRKTWKRREARIESLVVKTEKEDEKRALFLSCCMSLSIKASLSLSRSLHLSSFLLVSFDLTQQLLLSLLSHSFPTSFLSHEERKTCLRDWFLSLSLPIWVPGAHLCLQMHAYVSLSLSSFLSLLRMCCLSQNQPGLRCLMPWRRGIKGSCTRKWKKAMSLLDRWRLLLLPKKKKKKR